MSCHHRDEVGTAAAVGFRDRLDLALSARGAREAAALAQRIAAECRPAVICSSPLR